MLFGLLTFMSSINTVDWEMFTRTIFANIFANSLPREFKVFAYIEHS